LELINDKRNLGKILRTNLKKKGLRMKEVIKQKERFKNET